MRALAVPGFSVPSVDSVGAGDAFVAALGVAVASGAAPPDAVRLACAVAATAVTRPGAQEGLPTGADVLAATGVRWLLGSSGPSPGPQRPASVRASSAAAAG